MLEFILFDIENSKFINGHIIRNVYAIFVRIAGKLRLRLLNNLKRKLVSSPNALIANSTLLLLKPISIICATIG